MPKKLANAAFFLPLFGAVVIVPPIVNVFSVEVMIFGIPLFVIYVFLVWLALIALTFTLSRRMVSNAEEVERSKNGAERP